MTNQRQVLAHIRALDPVPDEHALDLPDTSSTAFLERPRRQPMSIINQSKSKRRGVPASRQLIVGASAAFVLVVVGIAAWLVADGDSDSASPRSALEAVEQHVRLRTSGQVTAALATMTPERRAEERDFYEALGVWNLRGTQPTPCREGGNAQSIVCELSEENDFLAAAGLSPWTATITFVVDDDLVIRAIQPSVAEFGAIAAFDSAFRAWMKEVHPQESAQLDGSLPEGTIDADQARISLQFVDEFVAQSERYPLGPSERPR